MGIVVLGIHVGGRRLAELLALLIGHEVVHGVTHAHHLGHHLAVQLGHAAVEFLHLLRVRTFAVHLGHQVVAQVHQAPLALELGRAVLLHQFAHLAALIGVEHRHHAHALAHHRAGHHAAAHHASHHAGAHAALAAAAHHAPHHAGAHAALAATAHHSSQDRKSTRLNSSHVRISYAVFCLKKKTKKQ